MIGCCLWLSTSLPSEQRCAASPSLPPNPVLFLLSIGSTLKRLCLGKERSSSNYPISSCSVDLSSFVFCYPLFYLNFFNVVSWHDHKSKHRHLHVFTERCKTATVKDVVTSLFLTPSLLSAWQWFVSRPMKCCFCSSRPHA